LLLLLLWLLLLLIALHVLRQLLSNIGFYLNDEAQRTADAPPSSLFNINESELSHGPIFFCHTSIPTP